MLCLLVVVIVVAICNSYPYHGTTEYVCKDDVASVQYSHQRSMSPYMISVKQQNTHNLLVTISSKQLIPFTDFTIKSLYDPTSFKQQQAQFILVDDEGFPLSQCQGGQIRYKATLLWTTEDYVTENVKFEANIWYNSTTFWTSEETVKLSTKKDTIPPDDKCGKSKGCFTKCTKEECDYIVSWIHDDKTVTFDIKTKVTPGTIMMSWAAIGLSTNQSMGGSSIMMCLVNGEMSAQLGYTSGHSYMKIQDPEQSLVFITGDTKGNILHCTIKRTIVSTSSQIFDLSKDWYLLFARGNVSSGIPIHHDYKTASNQTINFLAPLLSDTVSTQIREYIPPDPWCGKIKGCFLNCTTTECDYIVSWSHDADTVTFDIQTKVIPGTAINSWAAIGLSFDQRMTGSSIIMCMSDFGLMRAELGFTNGHTYSKIDDLKSSLTFINGSIEDNIFRCRVKREIQSSGDMIYDLRDNWYFLFAHGNLSEGFPMHHDFRIPSMRPFNFLAPLAKQNSMQSVQNGSIPPDPACGKTKACFTNCTDTDCEYLISWSHDDKSVSFDIQTKVQTRTIMNSWVAIGLSSNQSMAGSSIMMCLNEDGKMTAEFGFTEGHAYSKLNDTQHTLTLVSGSTEDGIFRCTVQRDIDLSTNQIFGLRNEWYFMFALGNVSKGVPLHHLNKTVSTSVIDFLAVYEDPMASLTADSIPPDLACGKTKACFTNCTDTDCEYIVSWTHDDKTITLDIQSKVMTGSIMNSWAAIGLTAYPSMPGSSVMMCLVSDGKMSAEFGYNPGYIYNKSNDTQHILEFVNGSTNGNIFHCTVKRDIDISTDKIFSLKNKWYLLFANGNVNQGIPMEHNNKAMSKSDIDFLAPIEHRQDSSKYYLPKELYDINVADSNQVPTITLDSDCDVSKSCFHDCNTNECNYLVSWSNDGSDVTFNITTTMRSDTINNGWVAVGFSPTGKMDFSSTMMCLHENGTFHGQYGYTSKYKEYYPIQNGTIPIISSFTDGDILHCSIQRPIISTNDKIFNLTEKWHMIFAHGEISLRGRHVPNGHNFRVGGNNKIDFRAPPTFSQNNNTETTTTQIETVTSNSPPVITLDADCGITKGCFHDCSNTVCNYLVTWTNDASHVTIKIAGKINSGNSDTAWVGVGFSPNGKMPKSSFILCMNANGVFYGQYGYSTEHTQYIAVDNKTVSVTESSTSGNVIRCTLKRPIISDSDKIFNLTQPWHILYAYGSVRAVPGGTPIASFHDFRVGGDDSINFLGSNTTSPTARPDTTDTISTTASPDTTKPNSPPVITLDADCGITKGCFHDCSNTVCNYLVTWTNDASHVTIKIAGKINSGNSDTAWVGVGFSPNGKMPKSSFILCMNANGVFYGQYGYSTEHTQYIAVDNKTVSVTESSTSGNVIRCTLKRPIISDSDKIFNLTQPWHILYAYGSVRAVPGGTPIASFHDFRVGGDDSINFLGSNTTSPTARPDTTDTISTTASPDTTKPNSPPVITLDADCGITKGCFHDCSNTVCNYLVTWTNDASHVTIKIAGKINSGNSDTAWVGVGFSPNGKMPKSSFILCMNANGVFYGQYGYSTEHTQYIAVDNKTVSVTESSTSGNVIRCTLKRPIISDSDKIFNLTQPWHILYAYGSVRAVPGGTPIASFHDFRVGGDDSINFLGSNTTSPTARPDTTDTISTTASPDTTKPNSQPVITPDADCGITKGCFHDCSNTVCNYLVTWTNDASHVTIKIAGKINSGNSDTAWVGVGFSPNGKMPKSSFILCMNANGVFYGQYGYSTEYTRYIAVDNKTVSVTESSTSGNVIRCTLKRPIISDSDKIFNLTQQWHILYAYGPVSVVPGGSPNPNYHDFRIGGSYKIDFLKVSSEPTTVIPDSTTPNHDTTTASQSPGTITLDPECGKTKGCFPQCSGTSCTSLVTWQKDNDVITFEVAEDISNSITDRWIAIGFSPNQNMGETSVIMCQSKSNGDKSVNIGYNDGLVYSSMNAPHMISNQSMTVHGQVMRCNFKRVISSSNPKIFDLSSDWYILMGNGPIIGGIPQKHENTPISTSSVVDFKKFSMVHGGIQASLTIKIHGSLMAVAWILFSSIGIILARYFKKHWSESTWMKQKIWFQIHRTCMVLTVLCTMAGFILMMVENKGYRELTETGEKSYVNYHPIFGIIVFGLALLNPIIALFRCAPDHDHRPIFNWMHSIVGTSAHILGAITVGFGLNIPKAGVHSDVNYVIIAYAISFVVIEFLLMQLSKQSNMPVINYIVKNSYDDTGQPWSTDDISKEQKVFNLSGNAEDTPSMDSPAMKFVLFLHFVAMITCCALIVYMVLES